MKKVDIHFLVFLLLLTVIACSNYNGKPESIGSNYMRSRVYVDGVQASESITTSDSLAIEVKGNLPSPAHSLERFDVRVKGHRIEITPVTDFNSDVIAAQVLVPFQKTVMVKKLKPGKYQIEVVTGKGTVFEGKQVEVKK